MKPQNPKRTMKKVYYLSTCNTCTRIIKELNLTNSFEMQDIKFDKITAKQLTELKKLAGSYEALFNRRSRQYTARNLKNQELTEQDYKSLILEEYTFLKRPTIVVDDQIFIGSTKKNLESLKDLI